MSSFEEVKNSIRKVLDIVSKEKIISKNKLNIESFVDAICNHLLSERYEEYGLGRKESQKIREYIHEVNSIGREPYDYLIDLNNNFKEYFTSPERESYLRSANNYRKLKGLNPIILE